MANLLNFNYLVCLLLDFHKSFKMIAYIAKFKDQNLAILNRDNMTILVQIYKFNFVYIRFL